MALVGDKIKSENANWSFTGEVSLSFDEHVSKSVPLYGKGHNLVAKLADFYLSNDSICYDLGCSTGSLLLKLAERNEHKNVNFYGIDSVPEMIDQAKLKCDRYNNVNLLVDDLLDYEYEKSDLFVAYYTVQFVKPRERQLLINKIYNSLNWGGAFILFEKVRAPDARFQDTLNSVYYDYKLEQGYTPEEIIAKARSLKGVLEPFSTQGNTDLLKRAGFVDICSVFKYICFEGVVAIK
jgi:tRNA (cmo5U34)-methyltransferase